MPEEIIKLLIPEQELNVFTQTLAVKLVEDSCVFCGLTALYVGSNSGLRYASSSTSHTKLNQTGSYCSDKIKAQVTYVLAYVVVVVQVPCLCAFFDKENTTTDALFCSINPKKR